MAEFEETRKFDSLQPYCERNGVGALVYGPLTHGLLSGKMNGDTQLD
jgi:aryl-alcohol dehydrogenase-like predicted oxidoreductase